jgi:hypothetical protein
MDVLMELNSADPVLPADLYCDSDIKLATDDIDIIGRRSITSG